MPRLRILGGLLATAAAIVIANAAWANPPYMSPRPMGPGPNPCMPCPIPYAIPQAAPPSAYPAYCDPQPGRTFGEPPVRITPTPQPLPHDKGFGGPRISHSSTVGGVTHYAEKPEPKVKVSFWNQTGGDIDVVVGSHVKRIEKDRAVVLSLDRMFTWSTKEGLRPEKREEAPADSNYFDVVIR
jgi:hypothetical protein